MNIKSILLLSTATLALSSNAFAATKETYQTNTKIEKDTAGNYSEKSKTTKTELDGTTYVSEKDMVVGVDAKGNTNKSMTTKNVVDRKGLGNKHIVTTADTEKTKDGEVTTTHEKTVNGKTVEGTKDSYKTESKVQTDSKGNYEQKDITTKTDEYGTTVSYEKNANVSVDANGNTEKSTTTKEVVDPAGLNNKTTVTNSKSKEVKDGVVTTSQETKVDGKTVESKTETKPQ